MLTGLGLRPGDRVAVLAPNTRVMLESHYGVLYAGLVLVALNTRLSPAVTAAGGTHVCLPRVDPGRIWELLEEEGVTHLCGAPTVLTSLVHDPAARPFMSIAWWHRFSARTGCGMPPMSCAWRCRKGSTPRSSSR
jgi:acyl-CoA synthetase (AMP-forming)/AMP-acid ligase II